MPHDPEKASMKDVARATESLLNALAEAHRRWTRNRDSNVHDPFIDHVAAHCAFQALANAFGIKDLVTDEGSREKVADFIGALKLIRARAGDETPTPHGSKVALA